ncbi:DNA glycosylase [Nadsonia fulvescens var. elongata DSM 6958]|uniref:N-glycosylase/DNA lyase n=1 Tax=Nadsonia fulvescens var. elongata DSM 6958 TaxID=857566 RepID=A0A1E3PEI0_9ASCO|nr:DNA glycosylase [Nadsonia fulvescens var. elongata DSM 6958]
MTVVSNVITWGKIPVSRSELKIETVLRCGQTFRWKYDAHNKHWSIGMAGRIIILHQDDQFLHHGTILKHDSVPTVVPKKITLESADIKLEHTKVKLEDSNSKFKTVNHGLTTTSALVHDYFNLQISLRELYQEWSHRDPHFSKVSGDFGGIRILRQNPWENLISFICSTNNNIKRISQMVENLCTHFGTYLNQHNGIRYFDFPTAQQLAFDDTTEARLRALGFGYRAKYIYQTARMVAAHPNQESWLFDLRQMSYPDTHAELVQFMGVGPKVADCVCLMSLDKSDIVPVDTHMIQIVQRDYKFGRGIKTLNKTSYAQIQDFFKRTWGEYAGWAHSVLFTADLSDLNNGVGSSKELSVKARSKLGATVKVELIAESSSLSLSPSARDLRLQKRKESVDIQSTTVKKIKVKTGIKVEEIKVEC